MKVRSAGLKFKIATNFIWRVGHGVHHRDSILPPYGWSSHEVNSQRLFFVRDMTSRASRCKARRQSPSLVPWNKHGHLEQARTDLCPTCSVKVSHLDQARSDLCPASSVSVRCVVVLFPRAKVPPGTELDTSNKHGSIMCPAGSIKVGHFDQTRTDLCPARSVKVDHLEQTRSICALSKWTV